METRKVFFKARSEKILVSCVIIAMFSVYFFELFMVLPKIHGPGFASNQKIGHIIAGTWILISALFSMWKFISIDPGAGSMVLPSGLQEGWRYCWRCEGNFPPRSYHCHTCDKCALVRDHHCIIASNCVGYKNRRYFLQMSCYMWLALLYANYLNMDFVFELYHSFSSQSLLTMFMPLLAWMFGIAKSETFFMAMFTSFCIVSFLYGTAVLLFHLRNTLKGRTTPEVQKGTGLTYDLGLTENLANAFGTNWKFAWLSPFVPSPLPGDGVHFKERELPPQNGKAM